jgi:serine/threonine-protein kinase
VAAVTDDATQVIGPATSSTVAVPPASFPPPTPGAGTQFFSQAGILPDASRVAEEEAEAKAKRRKRITIISVISGLAVVALVIIAILLLKDKEPAAGPSGPSGPPVVVVPKVPDSRTVDDAVAALEKLNLKAVEGTPETSESIPPGQVTRFDPATGQSVKEGDTVKYIVSLGPSEVTVPDVKGLTQDEARKKLTEANLKPAIATKSVDDPTVPADRVVGTDPAIGDPITVGQEVTLLVSTGKTKVPDCAGKTQGECSDILAQAGLRLGDTKTEVSDTVDAGKVIRTDPAKDQIVEQNKAVVAVIAEAPKQFKIPDVTDWDVDTAKESLGSLGLTVNELREFHPNIAANHVIRTDPAAFETVNAGSTITLIISKGPDPATQPSGGPTN